MIDEDGEYRENKAFPQIGRTHAATSFCVVSALLLILASLWQHVAAITVGSAIEAAFGGVIKSRVGNIAIGLMWGSTSAAALVAMGMVIVIIAMRLIDKLIDE